MQAECTCKIVRDISTRAKRLKPVETLRALIPLHQQRVGKVTAWAMALMLNNSDSLKTLGPQLTRQERLLLAARKILPADTATVIQALVHNNSTHVLKASWSISRGLFYAPA
jgi:hypothetical protein